MELALDVAPVLGFMGDWWPFIVPGVVRGAMLAMLAVGLVLTYQTTGVLNLAFGAQAFASGIVYYDLVDAGWPTVPAALFAVFVVSPILGYGLDRLVFRHMRTQPVIIRLAVTIGMLTAIPVVMLIMLGSDDERVAPPPLFVDPVKYWQWGPVALDSDRVAIIAVSAIVLLLLGLLLRYSDIGLRMHAVVESPRLAEVHGVGSIGVSTAAWIISSLLAGLAGVMLVPTLQDVTPLPFTLLIMSALAAAVFAGLSRLSLAVLGAMLTGIASDLVLKAFSPSSEIAAGVRPSVPFLLLFGLLVFGRSIGPRLRLADPMAGVDPPPTVAGAVLSSLPGTRLQRSVLAAGVVCFLVFFANSFWAGTFAEAALMAIVFLSLMLLTGLGGHVSLCHAAFVGIGALVTTQLMLQQEFPFLLAALVGALVTAAAGLTLAIPSLRLGELPLGLATFGFGIMCTNLVFNREWAFGNGGSLFLTRPEIGPLDFENNRTFMIVAFAVLGLVMLFVRRLVHGTTGRFALALKGSPTAAASIGINGVPLRVAIFALSAGLAGLAGAFLAILDRGISPFSFTVGNSMYWMVVAMVIGVYTMRSAVTAGLIIVLLPKVINWLPENFALFEFVLFGLGVVLLARHPEGAFEYLVNLPQRMRERSRLLSGDTTAEEYQAELERLLATPEVQADEPDQPLHVLGSTEEDRLARRARIRSLRIELTRLRARIPAYPISFLYAMTLAFAIDAMSRSLLGIVLEDVRRDFGVGDFDMSALNAVYLTIAGVSVIPFGLLADRWDRRKLIALGFVPWGLAMMWQSVAGTFALMLIARAFLGSIEGTNGPATPSLLGDYYPVRRRNRAFGIFSTGTALGSTVGILLGGALAATLGWRGAFFTFGVIGLLAGIMLWRMLDEPERGLQDTAHRLEQEIDELERLEERELEALHNPEHAAAILEESAVGVNGVDAQARLDLEPAESLDYRTIAPRASVRLLLRNRTFTLLLAGQLVTDFFIGVIGFFAITFFRRYHGLSIAGASGVVSLLSVSLIVGTVQAGRIGDRLVARGTPAARVKLTWLARLLLFVSLSIAWATPQLALAVPGFLLTGYLLGITNPLTAAMSVDLVVARLRGISQGMIAAVRAGATALGPVLLGYLSDLYGMRQGALFMAPIMLVSVAITWFAGRFYDRDHEFAARESVRQNALEDREPVPASRGSVSGIDLPDTELLPG